MRTRLWLLLFLLHSSFILLPSFAATNDLTALLQHGLFEEEGNRNLDSAIADYQSLAAEFSRNRQVEATAVFRLGECYRKLGKTNEAIAEYQKVIQDFGDQSTLATLSRQNLAGMNSAPRLPAGELGSNGADAKAVAAESEAISLSTELDRLQKLDQDRLRVAIQQSYGNPVLTKLLQDRADAQQKLITLTRDVTPEHPTYRNTKALLDTIDKQIDEQVEGVLDGLKAKRDAASATAKMLRAEAGGPASLGEATAGSATVDNAEDQEIQRLQQMLRNSPDLINAPKDGFTPLGAAATHGWMRAATYLLNHGADIDAGEATALYRAAAAGNRTMVEFLLDHGANVNAKGFQDGTPLHEAAERGFQAVTEVLVAHKADLGARDALGATPMNAAVHRGKAAIARMLLKAGAGVDAQDKSGRTPLSYAIDRRLGDMVDLLLAAKADPNGGRLDPPLLCAIYNSDRSLVEILLKAGADPNRKSAVGATISQSVKNYNETTPLQLAVCINQAPMVKLLLQFKANPNDPESDGTPLIFDALHNPEILEALLDAGANQDAGHQAIQGNSETEGVTPLMWLAWDGSPKSWEANLAAARLLLAHGANPNARNRNGDTALHWAANGGNAGLVQLLLENKADPNLRNNRGETALEMAKQRQTLQGNIASSFAKVASLLRQHGALDNLPNWDRIQITRPSANYSATIFRKDPRDRNAFTLLELIAMNYGLIADRPTSPPPRAFPPMPMYIGADSSLAFPDLRHVVIHRPASDGRKWSSILVDVGALLESGDCSGNVLLQWGDMVEIPETDHPVSEAWRGFSLHSGSNLVHCVSRTVKIIVQRAESEFTPSLVYEPLPPGHYSNRISPSFMVRAVLDESRLVRFSSDLSRVKVTRRESGKALEWVVDCSGTNAPDLWLRDGDVIEVPDK